MEEERLEAGLEAKEKEFEDLEGDEAFIQQIRAQLVDLENQKEALEALEKEEKKLEKTRAL